MSEDVVHAEVKEIRSESVALHDASHRGNRGIVSTVGTPREEPLMGQGCDDEEDDASGDLVEHEDLGKTGPINGVEGAREVDEENV